MIQCIYFFQFSISKILIIEIVNLSTIQHNIKLNASFLLNFYLEHFGAYKCVCNSENTSFEKCSKFQIGKKEFLMNDSVKIYLIVLFFQHDHI